MSVFAESLIIFVVAVLLLVSAWSVSHFYEKKDKEMSFGLAMFVIGIAFLLIFIAHMHVYNNGTEQDLIRWLFWMRG